MCDIFARYLNVVSGYKKIASFPLDISIAAYYIKNAQISYDQYIERISCYTHIPRPIEKFLINLKWHTLSSDLAQSC